ncbi:hypothetical protein SDC9_174785 [bioreactor metagenome]|uniref:Uncharacterized protein n=1 Tax=bioreactor metagenome TaxID=1076179 RepID=A0A645GTJ9_9ZZZZ
MVLADVRRMHAVFCKPLAQGTDVCVQGHIVGPGTVYAGHQARKNCRTRRSAHRLHGIGPLIAHAPGGQRVQMGRLQPRLAVAIQHIPPLGIAHDHHKLFFHPVLLSRRDIVWKQC